MEYPDHLTLPIAIGKEHLRFRMLGYRAERAIEVAVKDELLTQKGFGPVSVLAKPYFISVVFAWDHMMIAPYPPEARNLIREIESDEEIETPVKFTMEFVKL